MKFSISLFIFTLMVATFNAEEFEYKYQAKWYDGANECSYDHQSPIEIISSEAIVTTDMSAITFQNYDMTYDNAAEFSNNGHTANIQLPKPSGYVSTLWQIYDKLLPAISGGPLVYGRYITDSVHFHWGSKDAHGSEHVIDSQRYSMEMHIVHRNSKYQTIDEAKLHSDGLAVLAVLYDVKAIQITSFAGLNNIINSLASIKNYDNVTEIANLKLTDLFGDMTQTEFYTYEGSLTTPPCSQVVTWIVFPQVITISHLQMARFRLLSDDHGEVMENNYRHLQSKGMRQVYHRQKYNISDAIIQLPGIWDIVDKLKPEPFHNDELVNAPLSNNI